jgi:DNA-binding CsgD family transcriptional regulator
MTAPAAAGDELERRAARALATARRLLGEEGHAPAPTAGQLRATAAAVAGALAAGASAEPWHQVAALHDHQVAIVRHRYARRLGALDRVHDALAGLRAITAPPELLARAPAALCAATDLDRAVVSRVRDGLLVAEAVHVAGDPAAAADALAALGAAPARLEHPLVEAEALRRRRALLVHDAQEHPRVHRPAAEALGWTDYVAAPLVAGERVVGFLHAGRRPGRRPADALDRDVVGSFALGLAQAYETASLRRALRREREEMRRLLDWLNVRSSELSDAAVELVAEPSAPPERPAGEEPDDRTVFDGLLTRRELEVLRLMARGRTNAAIAGELVVAGGTVKFHVNNILRKLRAANRAEAVSRYLQLTAGAPR